MSKGLNLKAWQNPTLQSRSQENQMTRNSAGQRMAALNPAVATVQP
jgi:hypothetical protein